MIKWLIRGIVAIVLLIIIATLAAPFLIPVGWVKDEVVTQVKSATGRDFVINGPVSLLLLPRIAVDLSDVAFGNPPGAAEKWLARLGKLQVRVDALALLSKRIVVDSF